MIARCQRDGNAPEGLQRRNGLEEPQPLPAHGLLIPGTIDVVAGAQREGRLLARHVGREPLQHRAIRRVARLAVAKHRERQAQSVVLSRGATTQHRKQQAGQR